MMSRVGLFLSLLFVVLAGGRLGAANITVCASSCSFTNANLQSALDAANPGDEVLLQQGFIYSGQFLMKQKTCPANNDTCYVTVRTGVTSTGTVVSTSVFPAANIRMTPNRAATGQLAILRTTSAAVSSIRADAPPAIPRYWRLKWLQFDALENGNAAGSLVSYGSNAITTTADIPGNFQVIACFFRGSPVQGQHRGLSLWAANNVTVADNYFKDIKTYGGSDGQVLNIMAGSTFVITNNYMEGGTEGFIAGGGLNCCAQTAMISAASTTSATFSNITNLIIGQWFSIEQGGIEYWTQVTNIAGNVVTWAPALNAAPDTTPGNAEWNPQPSNLTFTKNYMTRPVAWRQPAVGTPQNVSANPGGTGTLATGSYFYKVVARHPVQMGSAQHQSTASAEALCVITTATGRCTVSWSAVANATNYYIYGRSSGGQNIRWNVTAPTVSYADDGTAGTTATVPTGTGTQWQMKNVFEIKTWKTALIEGNIFENSWKLGQDGYIILFTPSAQASTADSAVLSDVILRNNILRHGFSGMQLRCRYEDTGPSSNWTISNNLFYDLNQSWGAPTLNTYQFNWSVKDDGWPTAGGEPGCHGDNYFEHNTVIPDGTVHGYVNLDLINSGVDRHISNLRYQSNIFVKGTYGLWGTSCTAGDNCWTSYTDTDRVFNKNVIADGTCTSPALPNPINQYCPTLATLVTNFVSPSTGNYRLTASSPYNNAGHDGTDVGANIDAIEAFTNIAISGDNTGSPPPAAPTITTLALPSGVTGTLYSATLAATGGTTPYTWAVAVGTLPAGLTLNASSGAITGTPTVEGQADFTISVTGAGQTAPKNLSILVTAPSNPSDRPRKFATYMELIGFRRETEPGAEDSAEVGDLWFDQTTLTLKKCTQTSPIYIWEPVGTEAGGGAKPIAIALRATAAVVTLTNLVSANVDPTHTQTRFDLTNFTEMRLVVRVVTAGNTGSVNVRYGTVEDTNGDSYTAISGTAVSFAPTGCASPCTRVSAWTAIPAGAKADVFLTLRGTGGDGAEDPAIAHTYIQVR